MARLLGVPATALAFLEGQFSDVCAIRTPSGLAYRGEDATFLAGLVDALYGDGLPFREVAATVSAEGRDGLIARGSARLGDRVDVAPAPEPVVAIPDDALVARKNGGQKPSPAPSLPDPDGVLRELMACVRTLAAAREEPSS
ncbi:MAG: hypothetical protein AAGB11_02720 [Pseudomonadota bacterium]